MRFVDMIDAESLTEFVGKSHPVMFDRIFKLANLNDKEEVLKEMPILFQRALFRNSSPVRNEDQNAAVSPSESSEKNTVTESSIANYSDAKLQDLTVRLKALPRQ
jgi:hypothetical protein